MARGKARTEAPAEDVQDDEVPDEVSGTRSQVYKHEAFIQWYKDEKGTDLTQGTPLEAIVAFAANRAAFRKSEFYRNLIDSRLEQKEQEKAERAAARETAKADREAARAAAKAEKEAAAAKAAEGTEGEEKPKRSRRAAKAAETPAAAPAKKGRRKAAAATTEEAPASEGDGDEDLFD